MPDLRTPLLWLLGIGLVAALGVAGIERMQVLKARVDMSKAQKAVSDEKLARQAENTRRALAALDDLQRVVAMQAAHAKAQKENVDAYEKKLAVLDGRRRAAAAMLSGCASSSLPSPPVIGTKPQATPLPASVSRIDPQSSQAWLREVESYLSEVDLLLKDEMPK